MSLNLYQLYNSFQKLRLSLTIAITILVIPVQVFPQEWLPVRGGKNYTISGMAVTDHINDQASFLAVHDNKKKDEPIFALITIKGESPPLYIPLTWSSDLDPPVDLEAISKVPEQNEPSFMAMTSKGKVYHCRLNKSAENISVLKVFSLPGIEKDSNFEGFSIQNINGMLLVVWAHRGKNDKPAIVYWGSIDTENYAVTRTGSIDLKVPWPLTPDVRHISDLKVDSNGILWLSSTSDPGDDGPFQSALYVGGVFDIHDKQISFKKANRFVKLYHFDFHKVEAFEFLPDKSGGVIFASDDENMGSSILISW